MRERPETEGESVFDREKTQRPIDKEGKKCVCMRARAETEIKHIQKSVCQSV